MTPLAVKTQIIGVTVTIRDYPTPHHTSWRKIAKHTEMMHLRHAIPNMVHRDDSKYQKDVIQVKKKCYFRPISGVRNFKNFISGFRTYHQKMQN